MTTKIPVELSSTPGIVDGSNATAITIDSSEDVTLSNNLEITSTLKVSGKTFGFGTTAKTDSHSGWNQFYIGQKGNILSENATGTHGLDGLWLTDNLYVDSDTGSFANIETNESSAIKLEAGQLHFYSQASGSAGAAVTLSEKMRIDSSGNVGINESTPAEKLQVGLGEGDFISALNTSSTVGSSNFWGFALHEGTTTIGEFSCVRDGTANQLYIGGSSANQTLRFGVGAKSEAMRIDSDGNVSLGGGANASNFSGYVTLDLRDTTGGLLDFSEASAGVFARIQGVVNNSLQITNRQAYPVIFSTNDTERMRIDGSGVVLIGKTNNDVTGAGHKINANGETFHTANTTSVQNTLHVFDQADSAYRFYVGQAGSGAGNIYATNTSITAISDERLKENIKDLETGLSEVMSLKPRRFDWKQGEGSDIKNVAGFIAQEVETVLPDLIGNYLHEELDDAKSVRMGDMLPTLVKAIQEQQTIIEDLKSRIETLEK